MQHKTWHASLLNNNTTLANNYMRARLAIGKMSLPSCWQVSCFELGKYNSWLACCRQRATFPLRAQALLPL